MKPEEFYETVQTGTENSKDKFSKSFAETVSFAWTEIAGRRNLTEEKIKFILLRSIYIGCCHVTLAFRGELHHTSGSSYAILVHTECSKSHFTEKPDIKTTYIVVLQILFKMC
jgi:hypothetical protein